MPTREQHLEQARHNHRFCLDACKNLSTYAYRDWVVTASFYAALHLVDAVLATRNTHPTNHDARDTFVGSTPELRPIYQEYRELKDESGEARYGCFLLSSVDIIDFVFPNLEAIGRQVGGVLNTTVFSQSLPTP